MPELERKDCCVAGVRTIKHELSGNKDYLRILHGMTKKAAKFVRRDPSIGVRELNKRLTSSSVMLSDVMGIEGVDPVVFYDPDGVMAEETHEFAKRIALGVAICTTRAVDGTCTEMYPIEVETQVHINERKGE